MKPVLKHEPWTQCKSQSVDQALSLRDERSPVELRAYVIRPDKKIVDVMVIDLSYDGCAVRTLVALVPGEKVKLSVLGRGAVNAVVRWCDARIAGLLFVEDRATRTRWPRKAERIELRGAVSLRRRGRLSFRVSTFDVTRFGCMCEFVERPKIYEHVWVKFDQLESIEAVVCWVEESRLGLMFKNPVHPAVFGMLVDRLGTTEAAVDKI